MEQHKNNKNSFVSFYDEYSEAIFRYCVFRVYDRERAKELMQETFTKTWEYLQKGNEVENMKAFLYRVAHNLCVNEIMRNKPYSLDAMNENIGFDVADSLSQSPEDKAEASILMNNMKLLKSEEKDILVMRYINDMRVTDIAEILDILPNTISVKIRRAEKSLKKIYKQKNGKSK